MATLNFTKTSDAEFGLPKNFTKTSDAEFVPGITYTSDAEFFLLDVYTRDLTSDAEFLMVYNVTRDFTSDAEFEFPPEPPIPPEPPEPPLPPETIVRPTCAVSITCPGVDSPISNFSSEDADPLIFTGTGYTPFDPYRPPPLNGTMFYAHDCYGNQISAVSQEDADFISYTIAQLCQNHPGDNTQESYQTDDQTACGRCPDGRQFCYTVPAFTFVAPRQSDSGASMVAAANAQALAYANRQVSILASQGICDRLTCGISSKSPLPNGKVGTAYSRQLIGTSLLPNKLWSIVSGSLPPGLSMTSIGLISGNPTTAGTYNFQVRLLCGGVLSASKNFSLKITGGTGLQAYWTLDEFYVFQPKIDKVHGVALNVDTSPPYGSPTLNGSGLYGYDIAFRTPGVAARLASLNLPELSYQAGAGITLWFWFRYNAISSGPPVMFTDLQLFDSGGSSLGGLAVFINSPSIAVYASDGVNTQNANGSLSLIPGIWQLIAVKYDGSRVSVKVNDGAWVASAGTVNIVGAYSALFELTGISGTYSPIPVDFSVDEIGIAYKSLTDAQLTQIYNAGAGVTWPAIQTIVPL